MPNTYAAMSLVTTIAMGNANQIMPSNINENDCIDGTRIRHAISIQLMWLNCYLRPFSRRSCDTNSIMIASIIKYDTRF